MRVDAFTRQRLVDEGITNPEDLFHFNPDMIKQVDRNLRKPNGEMADPAPNACVPYIKGFSQEERRTWGMDGYYEPVYERREMEG